MSDYITDGNPTAGPRAILSYYRDMKNSGKASAFDATSRLFHISPDELSRLLRLYSIEESSKSTGPYSDGFSWEDLSGIGSFAGRLRYVSERLQKIGTGSSRAVFAVDDGIALKVAINKKGLAQNAEERKLSDDSYVQGLFAKVIRCSDDCRFLEMERARKCTKKEFERYTGVSMDTVWQYLLAYDTRYLHPGKGYRVREPEGFDELHENDFLMAIVDFAGCFNVPIPGDFTKLSSYGFVNRDGEEKLVMVDYGFSGDAVKMYRRD